MKMLLGGLSKSVVATWLELASAALELGLLEDFQEDSAHYYPAITALVERMEPTVRGAGLRRSEEMDQLQAMLKELGKNGVFAEHAKELFIACANIASEEEPDGERTSLTALVECYGLKNCSAEDS